MPNTVIGRELADLNCLTEAVRDIENKLKWTVARMCLKGWGSRT